MKPKKPRKPRPPIVKKEDLVKSLNALLTEEHWQLIEKLMGRKTPKTERQKQNFLSGIFIRKRTLRSAKGIARNLQQWACAKIGQLTSMEWGKDCEIDSREMGQSGPDVKLSKLVRELFALTVECKSGDNWNIAQAIKQAKTNLYENTNWLVILERPHIQQEKRIPPIVVIDGELFFKILRKYKEDSGKGLRELWK
jgi:hypothetical protein